MRKKCFPVRTHNDFNSRLPLKRPNNYVSILNVNNPFISLDNQIQTRYLNQNAYTSMRDCITCSYQDGIQDVIKIFWISQKEANFMKSINSDNIE